MFYKANVKRKNLLPEERKIKVNAVMGRVIPAVIGCILSVIIEILLNRAGLLIWDYWWWQPNFPFVLFFVGYCPFYFAAVVIHDLPRKWQLIGLGSWLAVLSILIIILASLGILGPQIPAGFPYLAA